MAQSIICAVNIMDSSQIGRRGKKALGAANISYRTTAELKIPSGFWNGFTFSIRSLCYW